MSQKLVQVNAKLAVSAQEFEQGCTPEAAQPFADVPGLEWKIWIMNPENGVVGGIKLFSDEETLLAYLNGPLWTGAMNAPFWKDIQVSVFDILPVPSTVTRAPLGKAHPITFMQLVQEAMTAVPAIKPADAYRRLQKEPELLVIDVRDSSEVAQTGTVAGAINITLGNLSYMADCEVPVEWRDARLGNRSRPIITTCILGPLGALAGKLLHDMGFANVQILEGGVQAWKDAGLPMSA